MVPRIVLLTVIENVLANARGRAECLGNAAGAVSWIILPRPQRFEQWRV